MTLFWQFVKAKLINKQRNALICSEILIQRIVINCATNAQSDKIFHFDSFNLIYIMGDVMIIPRCVRAFDSGVICCFYKYYNAFPPKCKKKDGLHWPDLIYYPHLLRQIHIYIVYFFLCLLSITLFLRL